MDPRDSASDTWGDLVTELDGKNICKTGDVETPEVAMHNVGQPLPLNPFLQPSPATGASIEADSQSVPETPIVPRKFRDLDEAFVGPIGGTLETANFTLTVPQKALKASFTITANEMSPLKYLPTPMLRLIHKQSIEVGPLLTVLPHDVTFERLVRVVTSYKYECIQNIDCRLVRPMVFKCRRLGEMWTDVSNDSSIQWQSGQLAFNVSGFSAYLTVLLRLPKAWLQAETLPNYLNNRVEQPIFQLWHQCDSALEQQKCLLTIATPERQLGAREKAEKDGYHEISEESRPVPFVVAGSTVVVTSSLNQCETALYNPQTFQVLSFVTELQSEVSVGFQDGQESDDSEYFQLALFGTNPHCFKEVEAASQDPAVGSAASTIQPAVSEAAEEDSCRGRNSYDFGILAPETKDVTPLLDTIVEMLSLSGFRVYVNTMPQLGVFKIMDVSASFQSCRNFIVLQGSESTNMFKAYFEMIMQAVDRTKGVCCIVQYTSSPFYTPYVELGCCQIVDVSQHTARDDAGLLQLSPGGSQVVHANVASTYKYKKTDFIVPVRFSHHLLQSSRMNKSVLLLGEGPTTDILTTDLSRSGYQITKFKSMRETAGEILNVRAVICPDMKGLSTMELIALYSFCNHGPGVIAVEVSRLQNLDELIAGDQQSMHGFSIGEEDPLLKAVLQTGSNLAGLHTGTRDIVTALVANGPFIGTFQMLMTLLGHNVEQQFRFTSLWSSLELEEPEYFKLLPALHSNYGKLLLLAADMVDRGLQKTVVAEKLQCELGKGMATLCISNEGAALRQNFDSFESTKQPGLIAFALVDTAIVLNAKQSHLPRIPSLFWALDNLECTVSERYMLQDLLKSSVSVPNHYRLKAVALILCFIDQHYSYQVSVFDRPLKCRGEMNLLGHGQNHCSSVDTAIEMLCQLALINIPGSSSSTSESTDLGVSLAEKLEGIQKLLSQFITLEPRLLVIIHKVFQHFQVSTGMWKTGDLVQLCAMMNALNQDE